MWQFESALTDVVRRTPTIKTFRFPIRAKGVRWRPGQFFYLTIRVKGKAAEHHFTISSSPTERGYIAFTKRITTSDYSQVLDVMKPGDWARLAGAEGSFTLPLAPRKLCFLSGGIGITPLRSMLRYITDKTLTFDVVLLYSNANPSEIAFADELEYMTKQNRNIKVVHVLSGPGIPAGWKGETGLINSELVQRRVPDYKERLCYVSGPPKMVMSLQEHLAKLGLPAAQVKHDTFTGYD